MTTKNNQKQFIELLKAVLWEDGTYLPDDVPDWGGLYLIACQQSLMGIVGNYIVRNSHRFAQAGFPVHDKLLAKMKAVVFQVINANVRLNGVLSEVVATLDKEGIRSVLLKGQGVAQNYPDPLLRQCGDIDLYVGEENYIKAADALKGIADSIELEEQSVKHYHVTIKGVLIEVHKTAMKFSGNEKKDRFFASLQSDGLSQKNVSVYQVNGVDIATPEDKFNSVYIYDHMFYHFMTHGLGLRQVCDWMYFIHNHREVIDVGYVRASLNGMNEYLPWLGFASLAVDVLGLPVNEMPLYVPGYEKKALSVLDYIFDEGNFGQNKWAVRRRSKYYLVAKTQSFFSAMSRYFKLIMLFPSTTFDFVHDFLISGFSAVWNDLKVKKSKK